MKNILLRLGSVPMLRDALKLSSSNILMFALPLVVTPILSRLYEPANFGEWGIFSSTFVIINVILFGCYEYAIIKAEKSEFSNVCALCLIFSSAMVAISVSVFHVGSFVGIKFFENFPHKNLLFSYLVLNIFTTTAFNIANRSGKYGLMSVANFVLGLSQAGARIFFGIFLIVANGLIAGTIVAQFITFFCYLAFLVAEYRKGIFNGVAWKKIKSVAVKYKKFPLFDAPATLLSFASLNLPILILSNFYSMNKIGCYSIIIQLLLLPMSFIGSAIGKVYYERISKCNNEADAVKLHTVQILKLMSVLAFLPALFIVIGGDQVINLFLGEKWTSAGAIAICLSLWSIPTLLTQPILPIYRCLDVQNRMFFINGLYFVLSIGAILCSCVLGLNLYMTLLVYAFSGSLVKFLLYYDILKLAKIKIKDLSKVQFFLLLLFLVTLGFRLLFLN